MRPFVLAISICLLLLVPASVDAQISRVLRLLTSAVARIVDSATERVVDSTAEAVDSVNSVGEVLDPAPEVIAGTNAAGVISTLDPASEQLLWDAVSVDVDCVINADQTARVETEFTQRAGIGLSEYLRLLGGNQRGGSAPRVGSYQDYTLSHMVRLGVAPFTNPDSLADLSTVYSYTLGELHDVDGPGQLFSDSLSGRVVVARYTGGTYRVLRPADESWMNVLAAFGGEPNDADDLRFLSKEQMLYGVEGQSRAIAWDAQYDISSWLLQGYAVTFAQVIAGVAADESCIRD